MAVCRINLMRSPMLSLTFAWKLHRRHNGPKKLSSLIPTKKVIVNALKANSTADDLRFSPRSCVRTVSAKIASAFAVKKTQNVPYTSHKWQNMIS